MSEISGEETSGKPFEDKTSAEEKTNPADDESDLPPLEDIKYDDKSDESLKKKNIVIPEDEDQKPKKKDDGWLDVLDNGELRKFVLTAGNVGQPRPERGSIVLIKLITKISETQERVESECFDQIDIILGECDVIQGLDLLIPLMDPKEVAKCMIASRFAYGEKGKGEEVPPNATLECEVTLMDVAFLDEETVLPLSDRIRIGNRKKERGNFWFGRQDFSTSISCYKSSLKLLDATEEELAAEDNQMKKHFDETMKAKSAESEGKTAETEGKTAETEGKDASENSNPIDEQKVKELVELRSATYNNLAMAQMKIEDFKGALSSVEAALITQPNNVKALFRKGKILAEKGELEEAIETLRKALSLEPENKAIAQELSKYGAKRKKELVTERNLYKRMLELDKNSPQSKGIDINSNRNWRKWSLIGGAVTASLAVASALTYKFIQ